MKKYIILCLLITGCATVGEKQARCENRYSVFSEIVACTKEVLANEAWVKDNPDIQLYLLKGEQLAEQVKLKEMTELDAKAEWQRLYLELRSIEINKTAAAAERSAIEPRRPVCRRVGDVIKCWTFR